MKLEQVTKEMDHQQEIPLQKELIPLLEHNKSEWEASKTTQQLLPIKRIKMNVNHH